MKTKNETKLMVKPIKTLTQAAYEIPVIPYQMSVTTYQRLRYPFSHTNNLDYDKINNRHVFTILI